MHSMTGFASKSTLTTIDGIELELEWDIRSVNGRGLDIRMRLPDAIGFIEKSIRTRLSSVIARGNVSVTLKMHIRNVANVGTIDHDALDSVMAAMTAVMAKAQAVGVRLTEPSALDVLGWRAVLSAGQDFAAIDLAKLGEIVAQDFDLLLDCFNAMRHQEGQTLVQVIAAQLDQIGVMTVAARALLPERRQAMAEHMRKAILQLTDMARPDSLRVEQELALIAVKADVTEELDRLAAHCDTARELLETGGPAGRKLDFLTQEFNREANTLCSKAQHLGLSRIGLDLKAVIDQMREQVQNLE
ncbi:YicC/YloC family endoribonuclease [Roseinatronobacter alkalisoli]|uniref:YicC family protein n=1 Tax=Roseinatronobacter alkalisoli TaxID=3028235 RepID=A0ABT5T804_9RHOB|nr:YicC/YloC family endoribonuclease [Roseinatronobacter sp. HJB301]MDD7971260.1 YicC family protein [Roseinatronobacter sp. HJB301]